MSRTLLPAALGILLLWAWTAAGCNPPTPLQSDPTPSPSPSPGASGVIAIPDGPKRDPFDLARRFRGVDARPLSFESLFPEEQVGAQVTFWVLEDAGASVRQAQAELLHVGAHALWYVESGVGAAGLAEAARTFDEHILPRVLDTFGPQLALPGPITILTVRLSQVGGYFTSVDFLPTAVEPISNERAMLYVNADVPLESPHYLGTVTHELQHLVQAVIDPDEETWVHEGLATLASSVAGYPAIPPSLYFRRPGTSIVHWPTEVGQAGASYAGAHLFLQYLASRTGGLDEIHRLVAERSDGVRGVRAYLDGVAPGLEFPDLLADWAVANLLGNEIGPYGYPGRRGAILVGRQMAVPGSLEGAVAQFGAWYVSFPQAAPASIIFQGASATPLLPAMPASDDSCWWSNRGDRLDATLTQSVDLAEVPSATLTFRHWHRMEEGFDYGYVAISIDGGATWTALAGRHATAEDSGTRALGPGYTGSSSGWVEETVDLAPYAGRRVLLRFEHVTDEAISADGWCIDDVAIPEIGFMDNVETEGNWEAEGFVRLSGQGVAQEFTLRLVSGTEESAVVAPIPLDADNRGSFVVDGPAVLVVTATAPKTRQPARFTLKAAASVPAR